jgi:hypothetical protein
MSETQWLNSILQGSNSPFLLDLENLYANALNQNEDPKNLLLQLPLHRVHTVHLSGGSWVEQIWQDNIHRRYLDDHRHDTPAPVFELLELLSALCPNPLNIIIERDGNYPPMSHLLQQLQQAVIAVKKGRERQNTCPHTVNIPPNYHGVFNAFENTQIEYLLARLFLDEVFLHAFIQAPKHHLEQAGLNRLCAELNGFDWAGLQIMARSVGGKNKKSRPCATTHTPTFLQRLMRL